MRRSTYRPLPVQHTVRRVSWSRAITGMVTAGVLLCLLGWAVIPALVSPARAEYPARLVTAPVAEPAPIPDLGAPAELSMARVTEQIGSSQQGDGEPVQYSVPRIMQSGDVLIQMDSVRASHPREGWKDIEQARQVFRFELIDALDGSVLGAVDITREEGVDAPAVVLAELTEPHATFIRLASDVRADGACVGCGNSEDWEDEPLFHSWSATIQYLRATL